MSNDPFESDDWRRYAEDFRKLVLPKISGSAHFLVIAPERGATDIQFMLQIGAAVVLDKPFVVFTAPGQALPPRLARIADKIIEADTTTEEGKQAAARALEEYLRQ